MGGRSVGDTRSGPPDLVVRSRRIITPQGARPGAIHIRNGRIIGVLELEDVPGGCPFEDAGDQVVLPGLVDSHVHVNEPGRTEWEGFETATRAAAAGGVTTIVDMPLNSIPPTTTLPGLELKRQAAQGRCFVDVGFWGGAVPGNERELAALDEAGVLGFKCFLVPSGVDEFPAEPETDLRATMRELARLDATLLVHAELPGPIADAAARQRGLLAIAPDQRVTLRLYETYLASRPRAAENEAIALLVGLCREYGTRTHVVHLSSSDALGAIAAARDEGLPLTAETCPHYLHFAAEDVPAGATEYKCAPPIRERENRELLWTALGDGLIDAVVSDHSPAPPAMKRVDSGDFMSAWGGIASLQLGVSVVWAAASCRRYTLDHLARWMCLGPARVASLPQKGAIDVGFDADLVVFDPDAEFTVEAEALHHRHVLTPYRGCRLRGRVERTYLRGRRIYERGEAFAPPSGHLITRVRPRG